MPSRCYQLYMLGWMAPNKANLNPRDYLEASNSALGSLLCSLASLLLAVLRHFFSLALLGVDF